MGSPEQFLFDHISTTKAVARVERIRGERRRVVKVGRRIFLVPLGRVGLEGRETMLVSMSQDLSICAPTMLYVSRSCDSISSCRDR